jgi:hypothetical protein
MPTVLQFRRGSTASVSSYAGSVGEIVVNTDTYVPVVQNAVAGGVPLQRAQSTVRVDFGVNPTTVVYGTISDSRVTTNSTLTTAVSMYPSSSNATANGYLTTSFGGDELEFDTFLCSAYTSANGTITYQITATPGPVANTRIFNYILS